MATIRIGSTQDMFPSPTGTPDIDIASILESRRSELQRGLYALTREPSRRASKSGFFKRFSALSVVSLTLMFVLLSCFRYVSFAPRVRSATRSLATGDFDGDVCPNWPESGNSGEVSGDEELAEGGASVAGSPAAAAGGTQVPGGEQGVPSSPLQSPVPGWGPRQMPPEWLERVEALLSFMKRLATNYMTLIPVLDSTAAVKLCEQLANLAVIELSAMAYIPDPLQPMRSEAADAFSSMIGSVQSADATRKAAKRMRLEARLQNLKLMIAAVGRKPPQTEEFEDYMATMIDCWNVGAHAVSQVSAQLESLLLEQQQRPNPQMVQKVLKVAQAVFITRRTQLLEIRTIADWVCGCQESVGASLIYTRKEIRGAFGKLKQQDVGPIQEIDRAVMAAGGAPVSSALSVSSVKHEPPSGYSATPHFSGISAARLQPQDLQSPRPSPEPRQPPVPPTADMEALELSDQPSGRGLVGTPAQPPPPARTSQQASPTTRQAGHPHPAPSSHTSHQPQHNVPDSWEELGALPRQQVAESAQSRTEERQPQHQQLPPNWSSSMRDVLELMQTAAFTCGSLLPSLSPTEGVLLSMHLSMLTAVQVSALAHLPAELQPVRQKVAASYRQLLDFVLTTEPVRSAAASEGVTSRIESLQVLLERLGGAPPEIQIEPQQYMVEMKYLYRVSRFTYLQVSSFLRELLLSQQPTKRGPVQPKAIIKAVEKMAYVLKMQLLTDPLRSSWFVSQSSGLEYPLCTAADVEKAASMNRLKAKPLMERLQFWVSRMKARPIGVEAGALPSELEGPSSAPAVTEQSSADITVSLPRV
ncbi:hypothetical protein Emag_000515 [Eimeria magna]